MTLVEDKNSLRKLNLKIDCSAEKTQQINLKNGCFGLIEMIVLGLRFHLRKWLGAKVSLEGLGSWVSDLIFRVPSHDF